MRRLTRPVFFALLSYTLLYGPVVNAGMYKWVDDKGEVHYGDSIPPRYADKERKRLNERGRTIKTYAAASTPEEIDAAKRIEALRVEQEKQVAEKARNDHVLLATYSSEDDMLKARDGKLSAIEGLIQLTQRRIVSMDNRMIQLAEDAADFERGGKPVPEILARQLENIRAQTRENKSFILLKQREQNGIKGQFQKDIVRFRDLHNNQGTSK